MSKFRSLSFVATFLLALGVLPGPGVAEEVGMAVLPLVAQADATPPPPMRLAESLGVRPLASLPAAETAARDQVEAVRSWNLAGNRPWRTGFARPLPGSPRVELSRPVLAKAGGAHAGGLAARSAAGSLVWGAEVRVEGAYRLRLHLAKVRLPAGARLWVYGADGETVAFGTELLSPEGDLWTPSVGGEVLRLEVEIPEAALGVSPDHGFTLDQVAQIVRLDRHGEPVLGDLAARGVDVSCLIDGMCITTSTLDVIDLYRFAVAHLQFPAGGGFIGVCTGGLLNDQVDGSFIPYLLTANHCFATQSDASGLEAFWDLVTSSCNGPSPSLGSLPRSNGSTLLATGVSSDYTLVRLNSVPGGRVFLGWTSNSAAVAPGTILHRLSHPVPEADIFPQVYTRYQVKTPAQRRSCGGPDEDGRPLDDATRFIKSAPTQGGSFGGSSGAPVIIAGGQVVGQLFGACGPQADDGCAGAAGFDEVDGAFSNTFQAIRQFLIPNGGGGGGGNGGPFITSPEFPDFRFKVEITTSQGTVDGAKEDDCLPETVCVSGNLPGRSELFMRLIGPRGNNKLWVNLVRFTPSQVDVEIEQLSTGVKRMYTLPEIPRSSDELTGLVDREAFDP